jgi:hypothetical protein
MIRGFGYPVVLRELMCLPVSRQCSGQGPDLFAGPRPPIVEPPHPPLIARQLDASGEPLGEQDDEVGDGTFPGIRDLIPR